MAASTRKPRQSAAEKAAAKAALDANAPAATAEKLTQADAGLTTSDEQSAAEAAEQTGPSQEDVDTAVSTLATELGGTVAPALAERRKRSAEAKAKRDAEKAAVAARADEVKAEQDANPTPPKKKQSNEAAEARRVEQAARVAKVIELRKAGKKLGEIATELGYTSQQVVSSVLRRHAPDLQVQRVAGTGGLELTPEQVTELRDLETRYGAKLATITKALGRAG